MKQKKALKYLKLILGVLVGKARPQNVQVPLRKENTLLQRYLI